VHEAAPARRLAVGGALLELAVEHAMERSMGLTAEPLHQGHAGQLMRASKALTVAGVAGTLLVGGRRPHRRPAVRRGADGRICVPAFRLLRGRARQRARPEVHRRPQRQRLERGEAGSGTPVRRPPPGGDLTEGPADVGAQLPRPGALVRAARVLPLAGAAGGARHPPVDRVGVRVQRLQEPARRALPGQRHAIAIVFSIAIVMLGLSAAFGGTWMERNGPRKAMALSAVCFVTGLLVGALGIYSASSGSSTWATASSAASAWGMGYISPVSTLIKWFPDRPGLATGMAIMGFGGGAFIASALSERSAPGRTPPAARESPTTRSCRPSSPWARTRS
jgi:hypothetical protein